MQTQVAKSMKELVQRGGFAALAGVPSKFCFTGVALGWHLIVMFPGKAVLSRNKTERTWQPAGQPAEFRSVAAFLALRHLADVDYQDAGAVWTTCLLQEGLLFLHKPSNRFFLSLGCETWAAVMWEVKPVSATGTCSALPELLCMLLDSENAPPHHSGRPLLRHGAFGGEIRSEPALAVRCEHISGRISHRC